MCEEMETGGACSFASGMLPLCAGEGNTPYLYLLWDVRPRFWMEAVSPCAVINTWNSGNKQKPSPSSVVCRNLGVLQDYKQLVPKIFGATDI